MVTILPFSLEMVSVLRHHLLPNDGFCRKASYIQSSSMFFSICISCRLTTCCLPEWRKGAEPEDWLRGHCRTKEAAEKALAEMDGAQVGQWKIRCGWAHHKTEAVTGLDADTIDRADPANTNVYVGNLPSEVGSFPPTLLKRSPFYPFGTRNDRICACIHLVLCSADIAGCQCAGDGGGFEGGIWGIR
jgi:hypothetical protein